MALSSQGGALLRNLSPYLPGEDVAQWMLQDLSFVSSNVSVAYRIGTFHIRCTAHNDTALLHYLDAGGDLDGQVLSMATPRNLLPRLSFKQAKDFYLGHMIGVQEARPSLEDWVMSWAEVSYEKVREDLLKQRDAWWWYLPCTRPGGFIGAPRLGIVDAEWLRYHIDRWLEQDPARRDELEQIFYFGTLFSPLPCPERDPVITTMRAMAAASLPGKSPLDDKRARGKLFDSTTGRPKSEEAAFRGLAAADPASSWYFPFITKWEWARCVELPLPRFNPSAPRRVAYGLMRQPVTHFNFKVAHRGDPYRDIVYAQGCTDASAWMITAQSLSEESTLAEALELYKAIA